MYYICEILDDIQPLQDHNKLIGRNLFWKEKIELVSVFGDLYTPVCKNKWSEWINVPSKTISDMSYVLNELSGIFLNYAVLLFE